MRIAHITHEYAPAISGVAKVVQELAERQAEQGNEVHVFTSDWDKTKKLKKKEEILNKVHIHRLKHIARIGNFSIIYISFFPALLNGKFDIIHSHVFGHLHFFLSSLAAKLSGAKHVHTTHCPWTDAHRSIISRLGILVSYNIFSRFALKLTDKIIAITPWEFNFIKKFGGEDKKIINIPNGMSSGFFKKIKNNNFKKKNKINEKNKIVLFFGRLNVTKGPDKLVEIAKLVLKQRDDVIFIIRGPDEGMKKIIQEAVKNEKNIILMPETRDKGEIIKMYQSADIFVIPSFREGLPLTLFEAMASGLPIVASPVNGIPFEMNQDNGFLVNYGDNKKFAEKIIELLDNKKLRESMRKNNLKRARNYTWNIIAKKTLKIYNEILGRS